MNDTVTKLLDYVEGYARAHTYGSSNERHAARQVLKDELVKLFTPLSQTDVVDGFCKQPHNVQFVSVFNAGARWAEQQHGITGEKNEHR